MAWIHRAYKRIENCPEVLEHCAAYRMRSRNGSEVADTKQTADTIPNYKSRDPQHQSSSKAVIPLQLNTIKK